MPDFIVAPAARQDLIDIWNFVADSDTAAADRLIDRFDEAFARLAAAPGIGHQRSDLTSQPVLFWPVLRYLIVYRKGTALEIVRVLSGYRDIPSLL
ncbi:MAG: type II toxin-antitoxin system RelE/ParE family toxin [Alphaproteobacteria bacterium]|nr:type II toxin-antitoxin system RelE/ParE family toxin [Alphaproteobacteria bacterium]